MTINVAEVRKLATELRIEIEVIRDAYWKQIDRTDNEAMSAAMNAAQRLNDAVGDVDGALASIDLAFDVMEEELRRKGVTMDDADDIDEDIEDEELQEADADAIGDTQAANEAQENTESGEEYVPRTVTYTKKRVRDGQSDLPEGEWLSLDNDFAYSKPVELQMGEYHWEALRNWKDTYLKLLRALAKDQPETFKDLPNQKLVRHRRPLFETSGVNMHSPQHVGSLYIETNLSSVNVAKLLKAFHKHFELDGKPEVMIRHVKKAG